MKEALEKIKNIKEFISTELNNIHNLNDCNELRIKYLSKKGMIGELSTIMSSLDIEGKKEFGKELNELKNHVNELLENKKRN